MLLLFLSSLLSTVFLFALWMSYLAASSVPVGVREESRCCHLSAASKAEVGSQSSEHGVVATGKHFDLSSSLFVERHVRLLRAPEVMKQHGEFAGHCDHGFTLRLLTTSGGQVQTPLSQRRVSAVRSKDVVGALDQQTSEIGVAGMGDAKLRIVVSGLTSPWTQAQVATDIATSSEPFLAAESQHEGQGGEVADAVNLQQRLRLRTLGLAELLDLPVVLLDLDCHLRDLLEHRTERLCQSRRHNGRATLSEARCSGGGHTVAAGLRQTTNGVHRCGAQSHQQRSRTNQCKSPSCCATVR